MAELFPGFETARGSDVKRNGIYLELIDLKSGDEVAEVFYADKEKKMRLSIYKSDMPLELIEAFIAKAKRDLS